MKFFGQAQPAACRETTGWLLGEAAPGLRDRAERHLSHCPACRTAKARLEDSRSVVRAASVPLDDLRRARMLSQIAPALDDVATRCATRGQPSSRRERIVAFLNHRTTLVGVGVAALVGLVLFAGSLDRDRNTPNVAVGPYAIPAPRARITPFRINGVPSRATAGWLGGQFDRLAVPAGTTVRAHLGHQTNISVIGPARLQVVTAAPALTEVKLDEGTLIADYDHRAGGQLRIVSPDGTTNVVGTLFSVAVKAGRSRVAVARGRVIVTASAAQTLGPQVLTSGQSWQIGASAAEPVTNEGRRLLEEHTRETGEAASAEPDAAPAAPNPAPIAPEVPTPGIDPASAPPTPRRSAALKRTEPAGTQRRAELSADAPPPNPTNATIPPEPPATETSPPPKSSAEVTPPPVLTPAKAEPPPLPAAPRFSAEAEYHAAEADMRRRDWSAAERRLSQIVAAAGTAPISDVARYELAQLALRRGDAARAQRHLDDMLVSAREPALREPAAILRCELQAESGNRDGARPCFEDFRQRHPGSTYDRAALGWLLRLLPADAPCPVARPLADEYRTRYSQGPEANHATFHDRRCSR